MRIGNMKATYCRNGSGMGSGYHVVTFNLINGRETIHMVAVLFNIEGDTIDYRHLAVLNADKLAKGELPRTELHWDAQDFAKQVRAAINEFENNRSK